jgi:replication factor C subunit 1
MTGFESSDFEDDNKVVLPSPKKKLKQQNEKSPSTPSPTIKRDTSRRTSNNSALKRIAVEETSTPVATTKTPPSKKPSPKKAKASPTPEKMPLLEPTERDSYDLKTDNVVAECLQGLTFCLTGVMDDLSRDDATDLLKSLGAKVTGAVSGKTSYLIVGSVLEDGRRPEEGRKYKDAVEKKTHIITSAKQLYGLCHQYQERAMKRANVTKESMAARQAPPVGPPPSKMAQAKSNPYAKKVTVNPYANKASAGGTAGTPPAAANPYNKTTANPYNKAGGPSSSKFTPSSSLPPNKEGQLWVDRHAPKNTRDILGNADSVGKLKAWLNSWERTFNKPEAYGKTFSAPKGPWKAALLSGPPGIGSK